MKLLDHNYEPFENEKGDINKMFWLYDTKQLDFMLRDCNVWFNVKSDCYIININGQNIYVPESYNIVIGDVDVGVDTISPTEIVGRDFDALTFTNKLDAGSWSLDPIKVVGFEENVDIIFPYTKLPVPVFTSEDRVMLISSDDCYSKIKDLEFSDFI